MAAPAAAVAREAAQRAANQATAKGAGGKNGANPAEALKPAGKEAGTDQESRNQRLRMLLIACSLPLAILLFFCVILLSVFAGQKAQSMEGSGNAYPTGSGIPPVYWPMYVSAASYYKVSPYLLASIHKQETGFSTAQSTKGGFNSNGCCAGPMQFNVKGGTWAEYENAFRPIKEERPVAFYPSDRRQLPSCQSVRVDTGCVYDDFDAIAAAADLLRKSGADTSLYSAGTRNAVCSYIGSCSEVDLCTGSENQYCQVLPRARDWEQKGLAAAAKESLAIGPIPTSIPHTPAEARALPGLGEFEHERIARWIIPYLVYARARGWHGHINQGYRTYKEEVEIATQTPWIIHAAPGTSKHGKTSYPDGAVDVNESEVLSRILAGIPGGSLLEWAGSIDPPHFSHPENGRF